MTGYIMLVAGIIGGLGASCLIAKLFFDLGYQKARKLGREEVNSAIQEYEKERLERELWQYEDNRTPLTRRHKVTGEVQKRYERPNYPFYSRRSHSDWQTIIPPGEKKKS